MISVGQTNVLPRENKRKVSDSQESDVYDKKPSFQEYSQVQRVEEKDQIFAFEICQRQVLELAVVDGCSLESGSRLSDSRSPPGGA